MPRYLLLESGGRLQFESIDGFLLLDADTPTPTPTVEVDRGLKATVFEKGGALVGTGRIEWFNEGPPKPANFIESGAALVLVPPIQVYASADVIRESRAAMHVGRIAVRADANQSRTVEGLVRHKLTASVRAEASLVVRPDDDEVAMLLALM